MTPQTYQRVRDLFGEARQVPREDRSEWLQVHCNPNDKSVMRQVESLLARFKGSDDHFLEAPAPELQPDPIEPQIAGYGLGRIIGEGGMGVVYEAHQQHPRRTVALKLLRSPIVNSRLLRRFEHEADVLGRLEHPGIARIYEAGTYHARGGLQPFFAMELVRGRSLKEHATYFQLDARARLELLIRICNAVQHAHHRGVVHRDLKPSNILVTDQGQPKVLDFGVARALDDTESATMQTQSGTLVGTLPYMSPEQASGDVDEIDASSDVYSLGVIAFELLSGALPYPVTDVPLHEAVQVIREQPPARLGSLDRQLRGDIEIIVGKALTKEKSHRYACAGAFAADIQRYLNCQPIAARPPGTWYQLSRFARRHKVLVTSGIAIFLILTFGIVATSRQMLRAQRAERTVRARLEQAENGEAVSGAVKQFMSRMLVGDGANVREQLDRAAAVVTEEFVARPLVESEARFTIGDTYIEMGLFAQAEEQLRRSLSLRRRATSFNDDLLISQIMKRLAVALFSQGRSDEAIAWYRQVVDRNRRLLGDDDRETIESLRSLGALLLMQNRLADARPFVDEALRRARALPEDDGLRLTTIENTAGGAFMVGDYAQAERLWREVLASYVKIQGEGGKDARRVTSNLASALATQGKKSEAGPLLKKLVASCRRQLGADHPETREAQLKLDELVASTTQPSR